MLDISFIYQYLFQFHRLPLEGIGEVVIKRKPASLRMLDKQIAPPEYAIEFLQNSSENNHLISWISERLSVSYADAEASLHQYIEHIKKLVSAKGRLEWMNLGEWLADSSGHIYFVGFQLCFPGEDVVSAEKLIRVNADHEVLIGDQTYSGTQLHELLEKNKNKQARRSSIFILSGLVAAAAAVILYCFLTIPGFSISNQFQPKLPIKPHQSTHKIISAE